MQLSTGTKYELLYFKSKFILNKIKYLKYKLNQKYKLFPKFFINNSLYIKNDGKISKEMI